MLTNKYPFGGKTLPEITSQIRNEEPQYELIKNSEIRTLLKLILEKDPNKRLQTIDIIENTWLTRNGKDMIDLDLSSLTSYSSISGSY